MIVLHFQGHLGTWADVPFQDRRQKYILALNKVAEGTATLE